MDYHIAIQITEGKEGKNCTVTTLNHSPLYGGGAYSGVFVELSNESLVIDTENGQNDLSLKQVDRIHFVD